MKLILQRTVLVDGFTPGALTVDGEHFAWSMEDTVREELGADGAYYWRRRMKRAGHTAIPSGRYEVVLSHSVRFGRLLPLLLAVPDFVGIRIHGGVTAADTTGCILLGRARDLAAGRVSDCAPVVDRLVDLLADATRRGKVWLEIRNP